MPVNNVGLLVYFSLGNKPLLVFVTGLWSLSTVLLMWATATSTPTASNRGNLSGPWVIGHAIGCCKSMPLVAQGFSQRESDKLNYYSHGVEE
jgi:hypothetical protein